MEMTELRLGNLVIYRNQIVKTTGLHFNMFECGNPNDENWMCTGKLSEVQPIEITEELLVKIGFYKRSIGDELYRYYKEVCIDNYSYLFDYAVIPKDEYAGLKVTRAENEDDEDDCYFTIFYNDNIKYLHELQNVYYCVTGNELEINL